jgi:acetoin utilization deacetylase AcuC-like enzyme
VAGEISAVPLAYCLTPSPEHDLEGHPENPGRFANLRETMGELPAGAAFEIDPLPAPDDAILQVHPDRYLRALEAACTQGPAYVDPAPTYVTQGSLVAARQAAGGSLAVLEQVTTGRAHAGLALVRPPGHHATATRAMGFCLLNNIAVAARHAQRSGIRRVMIVDFDVHHGNGTQAIFEDDPEVLYLSTHEYGIYPGSGALDEIGTGAGAGTTVNVPLYPHCGDRTFHLVVNELIVPLARRFGPEVLLVSAGFDSHWRDPLGQLQLTCAGFHALAKDLTALADELCGGRIVAFLEGGYDPEALPGSVRAVACALAHVPAPPDPLGSGGYLEPDMRPLVDRVRHVHGL